MKSVQKAHGSVQKARGAWNHSARQAKDQRGQAGLEGIVCWPFYEPPFCNTGVKTSQRMPACPHAQNRIRLLRNFLMDGLSDGTVVLCVRKNTEQPNAVSHKSTLFHADEPAPQFLRHLPKI
jgi:hypothetical protein